MKRVTLALLALLAAACAAHAQTLYRWVDRDGRVHYSDQAPPPGATQVRKPKIQANVVGSTLPFATRKAMELYPVTLYSAPSCTTECDRARDLLKQRGIPFSEAALTTAEDSEAFKKLFTTDEAFVPSLTVGSRSHRGFEPGAWNLMLNEAGYPSSAPPGMPPAAKERKALAEAPTKATQSKVQTPDQEKP